MSKHKPSRIREGCTYLISNTKNSIMVLCGALFSFEFTPLALLSESYQQPRISSSLTFQGSHHYLASFEYILYNTQPLEAPEIHTGVCIETGIADFRFHDLRHTAASWLRMAGADIHTVAQLLGHKDLRMAARYQHLSPAFLADAVGRLDDIFGEACHHSVTSQRR